MGTFVKFGNLIEGDFFFARNKFHCKGTVGLFQKSPDKVVRTYNAFYYEGRNGKWALFDELNLVQPYDEAIHGQTADISRLRDKLPF